MALKTFKPYTKSTRGTILVDRTGLWKGKPFKSLVSPKNAMKGRNNNGHITSINRAGGHKKMYRHVDFYRKKFDMPATVERIESRELYASTRYTSWYKYSQCRNSARWWWKNC